MKKTENGKVIEIEVTTKTEAAAVEAVQEKEALNLDAIQKLMALPANLPYPKDLEKTLEGLPVSKTYEVKALLDDYAKGKIVIPGFQRDFVWDDARCKALEYSVVHALPVPPIMLVKCKDKYNLEDGQQRMKALAKAHNAYVAAIADIDNAIANDKPTTEVKAKMEEAKAQVQSRLVRLTSAKIQVLLWPEMSDDMEKYVYAALNNGKSHTGSEWGRTFIPAQGLDFVQKITAQSKEIFGKKSTDFALYLWAGIGGSVKKTPAGKKAFPVVRREAESNEKFVFPEIPEGFEKVLSAIKSRPAKSTEDYNIGDFVKPGFLVPFVQGVKIYGEWDCELLAYVIKNIDRVTLRKVSIIEKESKGKNGPVTVSKQFSGLLAQSGSGEALTWRKAQGWAKVFRAAKKEMAEVAEVEEKDELLSELEAAVAEMEEGE